ncbi:MAG TPA: hypothetical protein VH475_01605 [Tepidisphaeraceae bacterium]|jgi:hypothetical protein
MTYEPIPYAGAPGGPTLEDSRRGGLIAFGIVSILIGALSGCMTVGAIFGVVMALQFGATTPGGAAAVANGLPWAQFAVAILMYAAVATLFIWAGVDSIRCRRWVRPVCIALGWMAAVASAFYLAFLLVAMKDLPMLLGSGVVGSTTVTGGPMGGTASTVTTSTVTGAEVTFVIFLMFTMTALGVIVPGLYAWFYSRPAVRRTLEAYDPAPSWTERCPLAVFVACVGLVIAAVGTAGTAVVNAATPFFGTYFEGAPSIALTGLAAIVMLAAAALMYRMNRAGWWLALAVIALGFASACTTLGTLGPIEFYRHGQTPAADLERLRHSAVLGGGTPLVFTCLAGVLCVGYLVWVGKYLAAGGRSGAWQDHAEAGGDAYTTIE